MQDVGLADAGIGEVDTIDGAEVVVGCEAELVIVDEISAWGVLRHRAST